MRNAFSSTCKTLASSENIVLWKFSAKSGPHVSFLYLIKIAQYPIKMQKINNVNVKNGFLCKFLVKSHCTRKKKYLHLNDNK